LVARLGELQVVEDRLLERLDVRGRYRGRGNRFEGEEAADALAARVGLRLEEGIRVVVGIAPDLSAHFLRN
jgi:hypothetical protein